MFSKFLFNVSKYFWIVSYFFTDIIYILGPFLSFCIFSNICLPILITFVCGNFAEFLVFFAFPHFHCPLLGHFFLKKVASNLSQWPANYLFYTTLHMCIIWSGICASFVTSTARNSHQVQWFLTEKDNLNFFKCIHVKNV